MLLSALPLVALCCPAGAADPGQTVRVGFRMVDEFHDCGSGHDQWGGAIQFVILDPVVKASARGM